MGTVPLPGSTPVPLVLVTELATVVPTSVCTVAPSQAQEGNIPWVGAFRAPPGPKGVKVGGQLCAELLRLSSED